MAVARSAARRARVAKDAIVANAAIVAIAAVRPSVDPSVARRIPRRASPWTISSSSPTSHRPPRRPEKDAPVKSNGAKRQVAVLLGGSRKP